MNAPDASVPARLREFDRQRPSLPGEHWLGFGLGLYLLLKPRRTVLGRLASTALGIGFVARALSGRDGPVAMWRRSAAQSRGDGEFVDVAAPWPYEERVRVKQARPSA